MGVYDSYICKSWRADHSFRDVAVYQVFCLSLHEMYCNEVLFHGGVHIGYGINSVKRWRSNHRRMLYYDKLYCSKYRLYIGV